MPLKKKDLKRFRQVLMEKKGALLRNAQQTLDEGMGVDAADLPDEMDLASSEYLQSFTFRLRGREKTFIKKIDLAMSKLDGWSLRHLRGVRRGYFSQTTGSPPRDGSVHSLQRGSRAQGKGLRVTATRPAAWVPVQRIGLMRGTIAYRATVEPTSFRPARSASCPLRAGSRGQGYRCSS